MDEKLNWGSHLQYLYSKLAQSVGLLKVASLYMSRSVLVPMFHALIMSHVCYGIVIWGNTFNSYLHPIHMMYNKAIRIISSVHSLSHILSLVPYFKILIFEDLYMYFCAVFMFKVSCHLLPNCLCKLFNKLNDIHERTRRCNLDFFLPSVPLDVCKRFVSYSGVKIWRSLNTDLKCLPSELIKWSIEKDETTDHLINSCSKIAQTDYKERHNKAASMLH